MFFTGDSLWSGGLQKKMPGMSLYMVAISTLLLLSSSQVLAFNITLLLGRYPDFSDFNTLLSETELAPAINRRSSITVLAVTNDRLAGIKGKPVDVLKRILSNHVILDYYDVLKLNKLETRKKTMMTTLYQASGVADDLQGFLYVVHRIDGSFVFGSAMKGALLDCKLEGSVASHPYNISVLSVSGVIIAPGMDSSYNPATANPPQAQTPASAVPVPSSPVESPEEAPSADSPTAGGDEGSADAPADGPVADAPAHVPAAGPSEGPAADAGDDEAQTPASSAGKEDSSSVSLFIAAAVAAFFIRIEIISQRSIH